MKQIDGGQNTGVDCLKTARCPETNQSCKESCANFVGPVNVGTCPPPHQQTYNNKTCLFYTADC